VAVETLKEGIEITATNGNVITFKIQVDTDNNKYMVVPTSHLKSNGERVLFSNAPVFIDDVWQQNFNGFNIDDKGREKLQVQLNDAAIKASALYYFPAPAWARPGAPDPFTNSPANANQTNQQSQTGIQGILEQAAESIATGGGTQPNIVNTVASLFDPNNIKKIGANDKYKKGLSTSETLVYPFALKQSSLELHRDTCVISMFNYVAPNQDEFFKGRSNVFKDGLQGSSKLYDDSEGRLKEGLGKVILPMPQSFEEKREVQYGEDTMNTLAAGLTQEVLQDPGYFLGLGALGAGLGAAAAVLGYKGGNSSVGLGGVGGAARTGIQLAGLTKASDMLKSDEGKGLLNSVVSSNILKAAGMNVAAETILARGAGIVPNPNMELLFRSPLLRNFGLAYRLTARSQDEAREIRKIIRFFKQGMSPRNTNTGNNFFIKTPNVFGVEFKTTGKKRNMSLPKFKVCALRGFSTDYSPDKMWAAYDDGQPVSVTIVLEFGELTPIYSGDFENLPAEDIGY
jgi:hypothetical protein